MKSLKNLMPIILVVCMILAAYVLFTSKMDLADEYEEYISQARSYAEQGIVSKSAEAYDSAIAMNDIFELNMEKAQMYSDNEYGVMAIESGEELVKKYPKDVRAYEFLLNQYFESKEYSDFFELKKETEKRHLTSDRINELYNEIEYLYELNYSGYDQAKNFSNGFWAVARDDSWGYLDEYGSRVIDFKYKSAKQFVLDVAAVEEQDGSWYYIDSNAEKAVVPSSDIKVKDLGVYTQLIAISNDGKYGYYDHNFAYKFGEYDYAGSFNCGVAPVKIGNEWVLINENGEKITESKFEDVVMDEKGVAFRNDRAFVKTSDGYIMIDTAGNRIGTDLYKAAEVFVDNGPAAVKIGSKWGFVGTDGKLVINADYDNAHSFCYGLAAVCKNGRWGYINEESELCIDYAFEDALNFNEKGVSMVLDDNDWVVLLLTKYNY